MEDLPEPAGPAADAALVRVSAAGICGSDLHNFLTGQWLTATPRIAGHEFAGTVVEAGRDSGLSPGDPVVADSRVWCGACPACRAGRPNVCATLGFVGEVCDGGFAPLALLPARLLVRHDRGLDPCVAAMAEPVAVALHAVRRLSAEAGEPVLVTGCGTIGGIAALLLSRTHDGLVLVADRNRARAARVAEVTGATVSSVDAGPARFALDSTGSTAVLAALLETIVPGGRIALVGISHGTLPLDPNRLVEREVALVGCHAFTDELPDAVALLPSLAPALAHFINEEVGIDGIPEAYARLASGSAKGLKTIVRPA